MVQLRRTTDSERGAVAIIVALTTSAIFFVLAALVVDLGLAREQKQASQISSDASALAAGNALYLAGPTTPDFVTAVAAAKTYAASNFNVPAGAWSSCTDSGKLTYTLPAGGTQCISFNSSTKPTQVRVKMPSRGVVKSFSGIVGVSNISVTTSARATLTATARSRARCASSGPGCTTSRTAMPPSAAATST